MEVKKQLQERLNQQKQNKKEHKKVEMILVTNI